MDGSDAAGYGSWSGCIPELKSTRAGEGGYDGQAGLINRAGIA